MKAGLEHIDITDDASLLEACDILHDAECDLSGVDYDAGSQTVQIAFKRYCSEDCMIETKPSIFFEKIFFPLVLCKLSLEGVVDFKVKDRSKIGLYTFNESRVKAGEYHFVFCEDMEMIIRFEEKPRGSLVDDRFVDERRVTYCLRNPFRKRN